MDQGTLGKISGKVDESRSLAKGEAAKAAPDAAPASPGRSDETVNLTNDAKLLARLDKALESLPAVDQQRVAEIKAAIANGEYEIDADAIADAMIRLDRSFGD